MKHITSFLQKSILSKHRFSCRLTTAVAILLGVIGFSLSPAIAVTTDPTLVFSTYFGGSSSDTGMNMAIDPDGNIYLTGSAGAGDFPATNPFGVSGVPTYLSKFDPTGAAPLYSILLKDGGGGIAADADGAAYVAGTTYVTGKEREATITKINPAGTAIVYSMYLGGTQDDYGLDVAVDALKNVYVVGKTKSTDFPTRNAYQKSFGGGAWDIWVAKINPAGSALVYSTYYGGTDWDDSMDITVDSAGNAYITGTTGSYDFPVLHPYQSACVPTTSSINCTDAYVTKFNPSGVLMYSTYLGGNGSNERGNAIAVDALGNAYVTGQTDSADFPTSPNAFQSTIPDFGAAFVTKISPDGSSLIFSTYLGGTTDDQAQGFGIAPDGAGGVYVSGTTWQTDFPTTANAIQPIKTGPDHMNDAFITRFNSDGQTLLFSTYFGGSGSEDSSFDSGPRIVLDPRGSLYLFGTTSSNDLPILNAFQPAPGGGSAAPAIDTFFAKIAIPVVSLPAQAIERNFFLTDTPTLTWTPVSWATHYHAQVSKNKLFTGILDFESETAANVFSITTDALDDGLYYWRVQAQKADGTWGDWSPVESFVIDAN